MNALARQLDRKPPVRKPGRAGKHATIRVDQLVEVCVEQRDPGGRLLVEAGTRGQVQEEMQNARGWWLVYYQALMLAWPTRAEDLRPARPENAGKLHAERLIAVLRIIVRLIRDTSDHGGRVEGQTDDVMAILDYLTGKGKLPQLLTDTYQEFQLWCGCAESGECVACAGKRASCPACAGSGVCPHCPRLAEGHRKLLDYLAHAGVAPRTPLHKSPRAARNQRIKRAA